MLDKILLFICIVGLVVCGYYIYESIPGEEIPFTVVNNIEVNEGITYGQTPMFLDNLRFPKNIISYYIDNSCSNSRKEKMLEAFNIFSTETKIISFYEESYQNADILVGCSNSYVEIEENIFAAGEGGPSHIINTTQYKVIMNGKISLYKKSDCKYPVVELHELFHVFGFDHTINPKSIMYNISDCEQRITSDMVETIRKLYSIEPKPDLEIDTLDATVKGRYLDFNITVTNTGLLDSEPVELTIFADGKSFQKINMNEVGVGFGRVLTAQNIRMPVRNPDEIKFYIDFDQDIDELNENNNFLILTQS